jgi:integrase
VLGACRGHLEDLHGKEPRWIVPADQMKNDRPHVIPLSKAAVAVFRRRLQMVKGEHLFPAAGKDAPMHWSSKFSATLRDSALAVLRKSMEDPSLTMNDWTLHGLRHTMATHMEEDLKVDAKVVSLLLSHTPPGTPKVSRIYNRAEKLPERRAALTVLAAWLDRIVKAKPRRAGQRARVVAMVR